jgi:hypothetical protein
MRATIANRVPAQSSAKSAVAVDRVWPLRRYAEVCAPQPGAIFAPDAESPRAPAGKPGLGQLVRLLDGRTVITRFGHGDGGAILVVARDGAVTAVPGLDATRRRIGLTLGADGLALRQLLPLRQRQPRRTAASLGWRSTAASPRSSAGCTSRSACSSSATRWDDAGQRLFVVERHGKDATEPPTLHVLPQH